MKHTDTKKGILVTALHNKLLMTNIEYSLLITIDLETMGQKTINRTDKTEMKQR